MRIASIFAGLCSVAEFARGLSPAMREIREKHNPEDRFNEEWITAMHAVVYPMDDEATFFNDNEFEEGSPADTDVLELTDEMFSEIFNGSEPPQKPWYIAFARKRRTEDRFWMSAYVVNIMKLLADEYQGNVRFAFIDSPKNPRLRETFEVRNLPNQFLYANGTWYEQNAQQVHYHEIANFVDTATTGNLVYQAFSNPRLYTSAEVWLKKRTYDKIWDRWFKQGLNK